MIKNTDKSYGLVTIAIHWLMALAILGMFCLGLWMVGLDYYSQWYKTAPDIHRSIGVLLFILLVLRLLWRLINPQPRPLSNLKSWEIRTSLTVHWLLYILVFVVVITGYLISTADGRAVVVFNWFSVPATVTFVPDQAEISGDLHYLLAIVLVALAGFHALAALKHHFYDKDKTLVRMFGRKGS